MRRRFLCAVSIAPLAIFGGVSNAQEAASAAASSSEESGEIIVTAQRRTESLLDTPLAITALSGADLREKGTVDITELGNSLPNVNINVANGIPRISIRGIGSPTSQPTTDSQVAFHVDGVYVGRPVATNDALFDIERVEVVRGPQGTLYGRNATGGALNVITGEPTDSLSGYGELTVGNYNLVRIDGAISGPLSDKISVRLAGQAVERGGYGHDGMGRDIDDLSTRAVRGKIRYDVTPNVRIQLSAEYFHQDDAAAGLHYVGPGDQDPANPGLNGATQNRAFILGGTVANDRYFDTNSDTPTYYKKDNWALSGSIDWTLSDAVTLSSITGYRKVDFRAQVDFDGTQIPIAYDPQKLKSDQFSQELRLGGDSGPFTYVAGLYYFHEDFFLENRVVRDRRGADPALSPQLLKAFYQRGGLKTDAYAAFAQVGYEFNDWLGIDVGGRYSIETKRLYDEALANRAAPSFPYPTPVGTPGHAILTDPNEFFDPNLDPFDPRNLPGPLIHFADKKETYKKFTPKATLRAKFGDILAYATYSVGFRSGGFVPGVGSGAFLPETLKSVEGGLKGTLLDRAIQFDTAVFYYDYTNLQVTRVNPQGGGNIVESAGSAELYGIEGSLTLRPTDNLRLEGEFGYTHGRYKQYSSVDSNRPSLGVIDLSGKRLALAPDWTANGSIEYTFRPTFGDISLRGEARYISKVYFTSFNTDAYAQDGFVMFDAYANFNSDSGLYGGLWVKNIGNKRAWAGMTGMPVSIGGMVAGSPYAPRTFGARIGYRF